MAFYVISLFKEDKFKRGEALRITEVTSPTDMKALYYMLLIIIKSPLWIAQGIFKHKGLVLLIVFIIAVFVVVGVYNQQTASTSVEIPSYQKINPQTVYVGVTQTRVYFINSYQTDGDYTILTDFYTYDRDKWERQTQSLPLKTNQINITER